MNRKSVVSRFDQSVPFILEPLVRFTFKKQIEICRYIRFFGLCGFIFNPYVETNVFIFVNETFQSADKVFAFGDIIRAAVGINATPFNFVFAVVDACARYRNGRKFVFAAFADIKGYFRLRSAVEIFGYGKRAFFDFYITRRIRPKYQPVARIRSSRVAEIARKAHDVVFIQKITAGRKFTFFSRLITRFQRLDSVYYLFEIVHLIIPL